MPHAYTRMHEHTRTFICICIYVRVCVRECAHACMCASVYAGMRGYAYAYIYVCMYLWEMGVLNSSILYLGFLEHEQ